MMRHAEHSTAMWFVGFFDTLVGWRDATLRVFVCKTEKAKPSRRPQVVELSGSFLW